MSTTIKLVKEIPGYALKVGDVLEKSSEDSSYLMKSMKELDPTRLFLSPPDFILMDYRSHFEIMNESGGLINKLEEEYGH